MAVERPYIEWIGAHANNFTRGRDGIKAEAVCLHIAGGSLIAVDNWFRNPNQVTAEGTRVNVSAHFCVGREGQIHQYVDLSDTAHANGIIEPGATAKLITENPGINPNRWTVSIEHEGTDGTMGLTDQQFDASVRLTAWLFQSFLHDPAMSKPPPVNRDRILMHRDITPGQRARCPGWPEGYHAAYIAAVKADLAPKPQPPPDPIDWRQRYVDELRGIIRAAEDDALRAAVRKEDAVKKLQEMGAL